MDFVGVVTLLTIFFECAIVGVAVAAAVKNRQNYAWLIAATFSLFALFDGIRVFFPAGLPRVSAFVLFVACILMLCGMWILYKETRMHSR